MSMWVRSACFLCLVVTSANTDVMQQIIVLTSVTLEVYDVQTFRMVEHVLFDAWTLVSPLLAHTTNGSVSYTDAITEVSHSMRIYKGKIFLLVSVHVL